MIAVPELKTIFITPPRTASSSLREELPKSFPKTSIISCHGEFNLIPSCFSDYKVVGVVRDPIERLNSLYNFIKNVDENRFLAGHIGALKEEQASLTFVEWLFYSKVPFTLPLLDDQFNPRYNVHNILPESQKTYEMYFGKNSEYIMFDSLTEQLGLRKSNSSGTKSLSWFNLLNSFGTSSVTGFNCFDPIVNKFSDCYDIFKQAQENDYAL